MSAESAGQHIDLVETAESVAAPSAIDLSFEEQFDELYTRAYGVGYQLIGRRSEAEDVAQETLARAFVHWRKVRGYSEAWVVRVAGNLAIDTWRKTSRISSGVAPDTTTPEPNSLRIDLHRALSTLSKRQREVLVLRFLADLPEADVAQALGCSTGSVKVHAARGLAALRST
ncbi:MAG: SigE family RNA polymerase sigma factor, partial [Acidimicrobiia bacterium]